MADNQILMSLLRLVALTAPAIAILMQYFRDRESSTESILAILSLALISMLIGGVIILYQLLVQFGGGIVFYALMLMGISFTFVIMALFTLYIPKTIKNPVNRALSYEIEGFQDVIRYFVNTPVLVLIPFLINGGFLYYTEEFWNSNFNYGAITNLNFITPSVFIGVISLLLTVRAIIYLWRTDYIFGDLDEGLSESLGVSIGLLIAYLIFVLPVFLLFIGLRTAFSLTLTSNLMLIPYIWATFIVVIIFSTEISDESNI